MLQANGRFGVSNAARASLATRSWHVTSAYTQDCGPTHARCAANVLGARTTWRSTHARTNWDYPPHSTCYYHRSYMRASRVVSRCDVLHFVYCYTQRQTETAARPYFVVNCIKATLVHESVTPVIEVFQLQVHRAQGQLCLESASWYCCCFLCVVLYLVTAVHKVDFRL